MTQLATDAAIKRFGENEERVDIFVNQNGSYATNEVSPRNVETLPSFMARLKQRYLTAVYTGVWQTATEYVINDGVKQDGVVYLCAEAHTSSGSFATDLAAGKWGVAQGVSTFDLAAAGGASMIGFKRPGVSSAVLISLYEKARASVSVREFGAHSIDEDGYSAFDSSAAINNAVEWCIANDYDLEFDGLFRVASSLMVDRAVDDAAFDSFFTMFSNSGGGIYVDSAINIFSSNIAYTGAPVSQLVRWSSLRFVASDPALAAYVLHGARFLRSAFVDCSFSKIKCLTATAYCQSIYFINCNARRWHGNFYQCRFQNYDIQVIGGLYEAGGVNCFDMVSPIGCKFITQIEGIAGTALQLYRCQGVFICCYFEANGLDFDCRDGTYVNYGVNLAGGYYSNSTTTYTVKWGLCNGCVSHGNWHTGYMHDLLPGSNVDINDFAQTSLSNGDAASHPGYRESTNLSFTVRSGGSVQYSVSSFAGKYIRNGKHVTYYFKFVLTSTGTNGEDTLYFLDLPFQADEYILGALTGHVLVDGSPINNGYSPFKLTNATRVITPLNVIPANVSGNSWTVRGQISYPSV